MSFSTNWSCLYKSSDEHLFPFQTRFNSAVPEYSSAVLQAWKGSISSSFVVPQVPPSPYTSSERISTASDDLLPSETIHDVPTGFDKEFLERTVDFASDPIGANIPLSQSRIDTPSLDSTHMIGTRFKFGIVKPNPRYILLATTTLPVEPKSIVSTLKHPGWTAAMEEEIGNCDITHTWDLVPYSPDMKVLGYRWVYRVKLKADGTLEKLRARLVAQGFGQEEGIDYS